MAVVWSAVQDHRGYIDIKSNPGSGTTISLYFKANPEYSKHEHPRKISLENLQGNHQTILLVDDLQEQLEIGSGILKKLGYNIACVSSGEQAVDYLMKNDADLVILDMIMEPGLDGLETYQQIISIKPDQKAIIASGYAETERVREALALGISYFIRKPYSLQEIGLAIKNSLTGPPG